jgi:hypothetical protein
MNLQWTIPAIDEKTTGFKRFRVLILGALAAFLVWEVTTRGLAAYLAETNPKASLFLRPGNSSALLNLIEHNLDEAKEKVAKEPSEEETTSASFYPDGLDKKGAAQIGSWAQSALRSDPLNSEALRVLGQLSDATPDSNQTRRLMQAAVRRSPRESIAVYYMMQESYFRGDYKATLRYADLLLRTRPQVEGEVMPMLGSVAESRDGSWRLKQLLATNPPWRRRFFAYLPLVVTDARTPLDFLLSVKTASDSPPSSTELNPYIDFLINRHFYDLAYYTWLQFLPDQQLSQAGHLFNGSFEIEPSGSPFDWRFSQGTGAATKIAPRPDDQEDHALFMQFGPGRAEFQGVSQLLMLPPGSYTLKGQYKLYLDSPRGLQWRISCVGGQTQVITESSLYNGTVPDWTNFEMSFSVPSENCPAQNLELVSAARSASEQFMTGTAWYDDLVVISDQRSENATDQKASVR